MKKRSVTAGGAVQSKLQVEEGSGPRAGASQRADGEGGSNPRHAVGVCQTQGVAQDVSSRSSETLEMYCQAEGQTTDACELEGGLLTEVLISWMRVTIATWTSTHRGHIPFGGVVILHGGLRRTFRMRCNQSRTAIHINLWLLATCAMTPLATV